MNRNCELAFLLLLALSAVYAEVVQWNPCSYPDPNAPSNCTIHEVRVDPCAEAAEKKPCRLRRGENASISFDYTPHFEGDTLTSRAFWVNQLMELPFLGMETNACTATVCPATPGQKQTYNMHLAILKRYPVRTYELKWRLWNSQEQECCFRFNIKIAK